MAGNHTVMPRDSQVFDTDESGDLDEEECRQLLIAVKQVERVLQVRQDVNRQLVRLSHLAGVGNPGQISGHILV